MWSGSVHSRARNSTDKDHRSDARPKVAPAPAIRTVDLPVSKVTADSYVAPASRVWGMRLVLAVVVAIAIAYVPGQVMRRDPRTVKLERQLDELATESRALQAVNADLERDIEALRTTVGAIEDRARADLGMVYPDEIVLRVVPKETK